MRDPEGVECGESKLAKMVCSGSLNPGCVNNDYEITEIIYSIAHVCHKVLAWSWVVCSTLVQAPPKKWQQLLLSHSQVHWVSQERGCCVRLCYGCCYSYFISQKRINVSAVLMALRVFLARAS